MSNLFADSKAGGKIRLDVIKKYKKNAFRYNSTIESSCLNPPPVCFTCWQ